MLGKPKKTEPKLFYHGVSLERRMPDEHPLRKIKQLVDFDFIRSQVAELYGTIDNYKFLHDKGATPCISHPRFGCKNTAGFHMTSFIMTKSKTVIYVRQARS